jgi:hypothetical protein
MAYPAAAIFWRCVQRLLHGSPSDTGPSVLPREFAALTLNGLLSSLALFQALHVKASDLDTLESALQKFTGMSDATFLEAQECAAQLISDWPAGIRKRLLQDLRRPSYQARILEHAQVVLAPLLSWQLTEESQFIEREIYKGVEERWQAMLLSFRGDAYTTGEEGVYLATGDAETLLDIKSAELRQCFDTPALTPGRTSGSSWRHLYVVDRQAILRTIEDLVLHEDMQFDSLEEHASFTRSCLAADALKLDARSLLCALRRGEISYCFISGLRKCIGTMRVNYESLVASILRARSNCDHDWISFNKATALCLLRPTALEEAISHHSLPVRGEKTFPDSREIHVGSLLEFKRRSRVVTRLSRSGKSEQKELQ